MYQMFSNISKILDRQAFEKCINKTFNYELINEKFTYQFLNNSFRCIKLFLMCMGLHADGFFGN